MLPRIPKYLQLSQSQLPLVVAEGCWVEQVARILVSRFDNGLVAHHVHQLKGGAAMLSISEDIALAAH